MNQLDLLAHPGVEALSESNDYLTQQLITSIGNKRALLGFIGNGLSIVKKRLGKSKLRLFDVFTGSGVVARYFKRYSSLLIVNDIEKYAEIISSCYLSDKGSINTEILKELFNYLKYKIDHDKLREGFIYDLYAPKDMNNIQEGERVFYTPRNAKYIDTARQLIEDIPDEYQKYFLGPLLSEAAVHANTSGVFKGFYKNSQTGIGQFGGNNRDALVRILGDIKIKYPVFSNYECDYQIYKDNSNQIADYMEEVDLAYLDPPYNQHPYGSNYFMLNLIVDYIKPKNISKISGIPNNWYRSDYNNNRKSHFALSELVSKINAKYLLISFNSEGFIKLNEMLSILNKVGKVETLETKYNTFRGSRNLNNRDIHVKEYLYLVEKN
ncbi:MAG: DNA adenine methylase [Candidatus Stahlbacteria bacterium]|nr:DNA adenine methylase [Candidatus Stahlbacteria bacterium]